MGIWEELLINIVKETVYSPVLTIAGATITLMSSSETSNKKKWASFLVGAILPLLIVNPIFEWREWTDGFKPVLYFTLAYFGNEITKKKNTTKIFNLILEYAIGLLTKLKG